MGRGDSQIVHKVQVTNYTTNQSLTIPGGESLILKLGSGSVLLGESSQSINIYPNPVAEQSTLIIRQALSGSVSIKISNMIGEVLFQTTQNLSSGKHSFKINLSSTGVFFINVDSKYFHNSIKLIGIADKNGSPGIQYNGCISHESDHDRRRKSDYQTNYLDFTMGDTLCFKVVSKEGHTTKFLDSPDNSKFYDVEFLNCKDADNRTYEVVKIGKQWWMAENLAYLPEYSQESSNSDSVAHYYIYRDRSKPFIPNDPRRDPNYIKFGTLYNYAAAIISCPEGWHLPTDLEWTILEDFLSTDHKEIKEGWYTDKNYAGRKLKSKTGWNEGWRNSHQCNGTDEAGFNALPIGDRANYWTLTPDTSGQIKARLLVGCWSGLVHRPANGIYHYTSEPSTGLSVRCVKGDIQAEIPGVETQEIYEIRATSLLAGGRTYYDGMAEIVEQGICWNITGNPTTLDQKVVDQTGEVNYSVLIENLTNGMTCYVRAYAINATGIGYGAETRITIPDGSFTDSRDSTEYGYINIGSQTWMIENLKFLPTGSLGLSFTEPQYHVYNYFGIDTDEARKSPFFKKFGVLYNHAAAEFACPDGWHLPSDQEWQILEEFLNMDSTELDTIDQRESGEVGRQLKSVLGWKIGESGDNSSGFHVLPAGSWRRSLVTPAGEFSGNYSYANFWSITPAPRGIHFYSRGLSHDSPVISRNEEESFSGLSVRCVKGPAPKYLPIVHTGRIQDKFHNAGIVVGSEVFYDGGAKVIERGVCWNKKGRPTINDMRTIDGSGEGQFLSNLFELDSSSVYYYRAYASNEVGSAYGKEGTFKTYDGSFTDARDTTVYHYVRIGSKSWMAQNLAFLPEVFGPKSFSDTLPRYYVYDYGGGWIDSAMITHTYNKYGVLYNWIAANTACPEGWHLPSDNEWKELELTLGMDSSELDNKYYRSSGDCGFQLMAKRGWKSNGEGYGGSNRVGFDALPGGQRAKLGYFFYKYQRAYFWTSSLSTSDLYWYRLISYDSKGIYRNRTLDVKGLSVRCIKD